MLPTEICLYVSLDLCYNAPHVLAKFLIEIVVLLQIASLMRHRLFSYWVAIFVSLLLLITTSEMVIRSMDLNDDHLIYGLDDAYIHMSIARNFVEEGVWGITPYAYSSTSSSPLWTFLIALFYSPFGVNEVIPLALNLILGVGIIVVADHLLRRFEVYALYRLLVLSAVVILTPLSTLILIGMEHTLQIFAVLSFISVSVDKLAENNDERDESAKTVHQTVPVWRDYGFIGLCALGIMVTTARYEGAFLVVIVGGLFLLRGRVIRAVLLGGISALPIVIYGFIAQSHDWEFLPASLIVKSGPATYLADAPWGARFAFLVDDTYQIMANQHVFSLLMLTALGIYVFRYREVKRFWDRGLILLLIIVGIVLMNVRFVSWPDPGTYSRYEAYLVVLLLVGIVAGLGRYLPRRLAFSAVPAVIVAGVLIAFLMNDVYKRYEFVAFDNPVVTGTTDIYRQQYQMGRFLAIYYDESVVIANDIGAINYLTNIHNIDLWGLGIIEIARAKRDNQFNTAMMAEIAITHNAEIAVIYDNWFDAWGGLPAEWTLVEQWQITSAPVILGNSTVSFFAIDPEAVPTLSANLESFAGELPEGVQRIVMDVGQEESP